MSIISRIYSFLLDTVQTILIALAIFLVIYQFLFRPFQVSGSSMYPNFEDKQYVLTNIIILRFQEPQQGDVVVFKAPIDAEKDFIKRVIGVPRDTILLKDGAVFVNNEKLNESAYLANDVSTYPGAFLRENQSVTVPAGNYFVLGDNRPHSSDSREWGFVKRDEIIGESFILYWPVNKVKVIRNPFKTLNR